MIYSRILAFFSLCLVSSTVFALLPGGGGGGAPVPGPLLGAFGPAGIATIAVGYVAYKLYQRRS